MKKIKTNKIVTFLALLILLGGGCASMIKELPPSPGLTKEKIIEAWNRKPDKICKTGKCLKYGADEVWIYRYPSSDEDIFYFKNDILVKEEEAMFGSF